MNAKLVPALLVGALLGFGAAFLVKTPEAHAQKQDAAPGANRLSLEFKVLTFTDQEKSEKELAKLWAEGWQYVGVINAKPNDATYGGASLVAFKRVKKAN